MYALPSAIRKEEIELKREKTLWKKFVQIIRDPFWQFVGVVITVVGIIVPLICSHKTENSHKRIEMNKAIDSTKKVQSKHPLIPSDTLKKKNR